MEEKYMFSYENENEFRKLESALKKYNMLENGDNLAVAVSGGKDSLVLLFSLAKIIQYFNIKFTINVITLDMCFNNAPTDFSKINAFCNSLGLPCFIKITNLWDIIFVKRREKNPCSLCSKMRKGILNEVAIALGCNKIAFGHHMDDAIETILMNIIYNNRLSCFSPVTYLSKKNITMIRPLVFCKESQILNIANKFNLPVKKSECEEDKNTKRQKIKDVLNFIEINMQKGFKDNFFKSFVKSGLDGW